MSELINDGGPAFPVPHPKQNIGMSLRDWFAGQALAGYLASVEPGCDALAVMNQLAVSMYDMADAMLKARSQNDASQKDL